MENAREAPGPSPDSNLPWPLAVINVEASSLGPRDYPIDVGLALWASPHKPIFGWSTLIRPVHEWRRAAIGARYRRRSTAFGAATCLLTGGHHGRSRSP